MSGRIAQGVTRGARFSILVDGRAVEAFAGETLATVLLAAGRDGWRRDTAGLLRGPFCNMGTCSECVVRVGWDDAPARIVRACLVPAAPGMRITTDG